MTDEKSAASRKAGRRRERAEQAARLIAEQKQQERRSTFVKIGIIVAAMVVIVAIGVVVGIEKSGGGVAPEYTKAGASQYGLTVGDPKAPHQVIMYEDFLCPVCDAFELADGTQLQQLASEGKVYLDYRPFHLLSAYYSEQALNAWAVVLKTTGAQAALQFHNLLYRSQPTEEDADQASPGDAQSQGYLTTLVNLAVKAGAQRSAVESGIMNMSEDSWVKAATDQAENDANVDTTPTVILDGKRFESGSTVGQMAADLIKAVS